eukprot:scaffold34930_cov191-Amphora_coffeaeformis.AAC.9
MIDRAGWQQGGCESAVYAVVNGRLLRRLFRFHLRILLGIYIMKTKLFSISLIVHGGGTLQFSQARLRGGSGWVFEEKRTLLQEEGE